MHVSSVLAGTGSSIIKDLKLYSSITMNRIAMDYFFQDFPKIMNQSLHKS